MVRGRRRIAAQVLTDDPERICDVLHFGIDDLDGRQS